MRQLVFQTRSPPLVSRMMCLNTTFFKEGLASQLGPRVIKENNNNSLCFPQGKTHKTFMGTRREGDSWMRTRKACVPCVGPWGPTKMARGAEMALGFSRAAGAARIRRPLWGLAIQVERWILQPGHALHPRGPERGGDRASASAEPQPVPVERGP